jgi:hypothetical protein
MVLRQAYLGGVIANDSRPVDGNNMDSSLLVTEGRPSNWKISLKTSKCQNRLKSKTRHYPVFKEGIVLILTASVATDPEVPGSIPGHYKKKNLVGLEWGPLSLVSTTEELLGRNCSDSGLESREYDRRDWSR